MKRFYALVVCVAFAVVVIGFPVVTLAQQSEQHPGLGATGFQKNREYFSEMPFENIDTLSGSVILTFTDAVLPGNAGRELKFQRTYNSKTRSWTFGIAGVPLTIAEAPYPTGDSPEFQELTPALHLSDGSVRKMAWFVQPNINDATTFDNAISRDFWRLNRVSRTLYIPNGDVCTYESDSVALTLRIDSCTDPFGNDINFTWNLGSNPPELSVSQEVGTDSREIVIRLLSGQGAAMRLWDSLTYDEREWDYGYEPNLTMTSVSPPDGPGWTFGYDGSELVSMITPHGGIIEYEFDDEFYEGPESPMVTFQTRVLKTRQTSGRQIPPGTWTYSYQYGLNGLSGNTEVTTPSGRVLYQYGTNDSPLSVFDGEGGVLPLVSRVVEEDIGNSTWVEREREEQTYTLLPVLSWWTFGTLELASRTITRDDGGRPFVTTFSYSPNNFGDYHHPSEITETGTVGTEGFERTTTHTYHHLLSPLFKVALPLTEAMVVGSETYNTSRTYDVQTGFKTSETIHGVTTTFARDGGGNVRTAIKANGKWTQFEYKHGQVSKIVTPEHTTSRTVNGDGTIASQATAGRTTTFTYDDAGRLETIQPPGSNATAIDYDVDGAWVRTTRGSAVSYVFLDGFGRKSGTEDPVGVKTTMQYDEEGRVTRDGYPFTGTADKGNTIAYDAIGRVTLRTNPDGSTVVYSYGLNGQVTIQELVTAAPQFRTTVQTWQAFGDPNAARLAAMVDANSHAWAYSYNALDRLVQVTDGTVTRSWTYDSVKSLLTSETHPESGTTSYTYDDAGVLKTKTDAKMITTSFTHDGNDRIKTITASGRETMVVYEAGSDNRVAAVNPFGGIVWRYDAITGRLEARQDRIGAKAFTTFFEYDGNDHVTTVMYPSGRRIEFDLNLAGQPTRIFETATNREYAKEITYHASGGVLGYTAGNLTTTAIAYDADRYWPTSLVSGPLNLTYADYDRVGNPHTITDARPGFSQTLSYDLLDRLTSASGVWGGPTPYAYDAYGNRTGADYQYQASTLRLSNQAGIAFTYDNNGNALTIGSHTFTYTPQNQVETASATETYAYDADDQRVKKTDGTTTTYYIRGEGGQLLTEWKDPGTANGSIRDYIYLGSHLISAVRRNSTEDPAGDPVPTISTNSHRYAASWQAPAGSGGHANLFYGVSAVARKSMHPDMPMTGLRIGMQQTAGTIDTFSTGPSFNTVPEAPKQAGVYIEFEVERRPYEHNAEWLGITAGGIGSSPNTDALRLYMTPSGALMLKLDAGWPTPLTLWTSAPIALGTPHTLELRFEFNAKGEPYDAPNPPWEDLTSWVQVILDGEAALVHGTGPGTVWTSDEYSPQTLGARTARTCFTE